MKPRIPKLCAAEQDAFFARHVVRFKRQLLRWWKRKHNRRVRHYERRKETQQT